MTPKKWGVLLVHGVGDTEQPEMISSISDAIQSIHPALNMNSFYEVIPDKSATKGPDFWQRRGTTPTGDSIVVAQVFWADLSRIREDWLTRVIGLFSLIFGFRHIAHAAADQQACSSQCLPGILWIASFLLRGPILAFNLFVLVLSIVFLNVHFLGGSISNGTAMLSLGLTGALSILLGSCLLWRDSSGVAAPWLSFVVVGMTAVASVVLSYFWPSDGPIGLFIEATLPFYGENPPLKGLATADARVFLLVLMSVAKLVVRGSYRHSGGGVSSISLCNHRRI